jgi:hypothetical protein
VSALLPDSMVTALAMSCDDHLAMMGAVQPFIDTAISKTVNVPADYPFEDFKQLYLRAHAYGLKGCATYRPNDTLGAVLEVPATAPETAPAPAPLDMDPLRISIEKRPEGEMQAVTEKLVYHTSEGQKSLYLVVSFVSVEGFLDGQRVTVERPLEVFIPAGQNDEAQQWVTAVARVLSLTARDGRLPKALADLRKVTWDKGPVRSGTTARPTARGCRAFTARKWRPSPTRCSRSCTGAAFSTTRAGSSRRCASRPRAPPRPARRRCRPRASRPCCPHGPDPGQALPRVRRPRPGQEGRLRVLHPLRLPGLLRLRRGTRRYGLRAAARPRARPGSGSAAR